MPRGYWGPFVAAFGWLILTAATQAPGNDTSAKQGAAAQRIEQSLSSIANAQNEIAASTNSGEYQQPCDDGEDNNRSDLCAQWHAARAARDAADWAAWSFAVGALGAIGIVIALLLTVDSNRIARETAKRQLRAYVALREAHIDPLVDGQRLAAKVIFVNAGQTPAHKLKLWARIGFLPVNPPESEFGMEAAVPYQSEGSLGPNQPFTAMVKMDWEWRESATAAVQAGTHAIFVHGKVTYEDVFGKSQEAGFRFMHNAEAASGILIQCSAGNVET